MVARDRGAVVVVVLLMWLLLLSFLFVGTSQELLFIIAVHYSDIFLLAR